MVNYKSMRVRIIYSHSGTALEVSARESVSSGKKNKNDEIKLCHVSVSKNENNELQKCPEDDVTTFNLSTRGRHCAQVQICCSNGVVFGQAIPAKSKLAGQILFVI